MRAVGFVLVVATIGLTGCAAAPPGSGNSPYGIAAQQAPKRLVTAIRGDLRTLSEALNNGMGGSVAGTREVDLLVNAGLGVIDSAGQHRARLAAMLPTLENGLWKLFPDGRMETTWTLRRDAVWHDGAPFTAADVLFAARVAQDSDLPFARSPGYAVVDTVEAPDPYSMVIGWKQPFIEADMLFTQRSSATVMPLARHVLEGPYGTEDKNSFLAHPYWTQGFLGTGPYRLRSWTLGSSVVLEANERYVLGRPKLDLIEVRFILDTNVIVANVLAGEVQLTVGRGLTIEQAILVRGEWRQGTVDTPLIQYTALWPQFLNPDPAVMLDLRFRRALYHALDRQQIVDTFLGGLVPVANSIINPDMPEYSAVEPRAARYPYDPNMARRLLEEIPGVSKEADGFYAERPGGKKISVEITTRADHLREKLMPVLADMWTRVGVAADPVVIPEQQATNPAVRAEFRSLWFVFNPVDINRYRGSETPLPENRYRGANYNRYRNAEFDGLIDRYSLTIPLEERYDVLAQIIRHMTENVIVMPLFHDSEPVLISERLTNAAGRRGMAVQTWNVHEWDLR